ncbi:MAG: hypothetical protein ABJB12_17050 [Pseudomonadota bacterium]
MLRTTRSTVTCLLAAAFAVACAGRFDPANFEGSRETRRVEAEGVRELTASTNELETLGTVHDSCTLRPGFRRLEDEPLSDLDCATERLSWALREAAASAGGEVLLGLTCSSRPLAGSSKQTHGIDCRATVARYKKGPLENPGPRSAPLALGRPAPSAAEVRRIDQPDASLGFRIALNFQPAVAGFERRPRGPAEVRELARLPLADFSLGDLVASCTSGCDERALRYGVLIAAGRLGVPDVVGVRCISSSAGNSCVGTLAAPTLEE